MPSRQDRECAHPVVCETGEWQVVVDQSEVHRVREQRASEGVFSLAGGEVPIMQNIGLSSFATREAQEAVS